MKAAPSSTDPSLCATRTRRATSPFGAGRRLGPKGLPLEDEVLSESAHRYVVQIAAEPRQEALRDVPFFPALRMTARHAFLHQLFDLTNEAPVAELFHGAHSITTRVRRARDEAEHVGPALPGVALRSGRASLSASPRAGSVNVNLLPLPSPSLSAQSPPAAPRSGAPGRGPGPSPAPTARCPPARTCGNVTAAFFSGSGANLTSLNATILRVGTVPLAQLSGITSNQLAAATWQLATNLNGGNAALATNVVSGIAITNAFITNSVFAGNGGGPDQP